MQVFGSIITCSQKHIGSCLTPQCNITKWHLIVTFKGDTHTRIYGQTRMQPRKGSELISFVVCLKWRQNIRKSLLPVLFFHWSTRVRGHRRKKWLSAVVVVTASCTHTRPEERWKIPSMSTGLRTLPDAPASLIYSTTTNKKGAA